MQIDAQNLTVGENCLDFC